MIVCKTGVRWTVHRNVYKCETLALAFKNIISLLFLFYFILRTPLCPLLVEGIGLVRRMKVVQETPYGPDLISLNYICRPVNLQFVSRKEHGQCHL